MLEGGAPCPHPRSRPIGIHYEKWKYWLIRIGMTLYCQRYMAYTLYSIYIGLLIGVWGGGGAGGGTPQNSGKQWVKFGQTVGEIRAKQEEKIGQRKLQINPFGMWMMTSHRQCPRGGACECPRVGVFFKFWEGGWRHAGNVQGGGVLVVICVKFRANQPLCPP